MPRTKKAQTEPTEYVPDLHSAVHEAIGRLAVAKHLVLEFGHDLTPDEETKGWDSAVAEEIISGVRELLMKAVAKEDAERHAAQTGGAR